MALYQIDARGPHYDDLRAGAITSMLANIHRDSKVRSEPFGTLDFIPWNDFQRSEPAEAAVLLDDAEAQSNLIITKMFRGQHG